MSLDKLIESYFNKKDDKELFALSNMHLLYEEVLSEIDSSEVLEEKKEAVKYSKDAEKFVLTLPKFTPSEAWGDPNSEARKELVSLMQTVGGGASLEEKIKFLERLQAEDSQIRSPRRIISTLILLESLSACVNSFGASTAGFIFEGFLAALLGGHQVAEPSQGSLPIEDIVAFSTYSGGKDTPMSLKLLVKSTVIKGSYTNLIDALNKTPNMVYVIAYKAGGDNVDSIEINSFNLSRENLLLILSQSNKNMKLVQIKDMSPQESMDFLSKAKNWEELYAHLQHTAGYLRRPPSDKEELANTDASPGDPSDLAAAGKEELAESKGAGTQWYVSLSQLNKLGAQIGWGVEGGQEKPVATLNISPTALYETAERYMVHLGESIRNLFAAVSALSEDINGYFTSKKRDTAITKGNSAIKNAQTIETEMTEQTKKPEEK